MHQSVSCLGSSLTTLCKTLATGSTWSSAALAGWNAHGYQRAAAAAYLHEVVLVLHRLPAQGQQLQQLGSAGLHEAHPLPLGVQLLLQLPPLLLAEHLLQQRGPVLRRQGT